MTYPAHDPVKIGRIAIFFVWLWLLARALDATASLYTIDALGGFGSGIGSADILRVADELVAMAGVGGLVMLVIASIPSLRWIYLTNRNAQNWTGQVEITPGWAVGWFFVPVACLFKPFEGVSETWRATIDPNDIGSVPVPALLRWWWGLWLAMSLWGYLPAFMINHAIRPDQLIAGHWANIASLLIDIPLTVCFVRIIARLSRMQRNVLIEQERAIQDTGVDTP